MKFLPEEYLDRLLAPKAIDPHWVALVPQPHMPNFTLQELEMLATEWATRDGYNCICQSPSVPDVDKWLSRLTQGHS